jgi:hypothetical protein
MKSRSIIHTCGHEVVYERDCAEYLDYLANYAQITPCWRCWAEHRAKRVTETH